MQCASIDKDILISVSMRFFFVWIVGSREASSLIPSMQFSGTLLFYRWTAATPWNKSPPGVDEVIRKSVHNCVKLRIPHNVTIKDAEDEGTDCTFVHLWDVEELHCSWLHAYFEDGPLECRLDEGNGRPSSTVAFLPGGTPLIDPRLNEVELFHFVQARDHSTLQVLLDLVMKVGCHMEFFGRRQRRRWHADANCLMTSAARAAVPVPVAHGGDVADRCSMRFPIASLKYVAAMRREYYLVEAEVAARCTADSGEGGGGSNQRSLCAHIMAIVQLLQAVMAQVQGLRAGEIMDDAAAAFMADTGDGPPPPSATSAIPSPAAGRPSRLPTRSSTLPDGRKRPPEPGSAVQWSRDKRPRTYPRYPQRLDGSLQAAPRLLATRHRV